MKFCLVSKNNIMFAVYAFLDFFGIVYESETKRQLRDLLRSAFQCCPLENFKYLPDEDKNSVEFITPALKGEPSLYRLLPVEMQKNADVALCAAESGEDVVSRCPDLAWKNNKELLMAVLKFHGQHLRNLADAQKNDFEIVHQAVQSFGLCLKDSGPAMRRNEKIVAAALKDDFNAIQYADPEVLKTMDFSEQSLDLYPCYIVHLDRQANFGKGPRNAYFKLAISAMERDPGVWLELDKETRNNVDVVKMYVQMHADNLLDIPAHLHKKQQVLEAAATDDARYVLENFPKSRKNKKIVLLYIRQHNFHREMLDPWNDYVMENFGADVDVAMAVAKKCGRTLQQFDKRYGGKLNINGRENTNLLWRMARTRFSGGAVHWEKCLDFLDRSDPMYTSHVLQIVRECPHLFRHVDENLKSNMEIVKQMTTCPSACLFMLREAGLEILESKDKMIEIIKYGCCEVGNVILSDEQHFGHLWGDEEILLAILERKPRTLMLFFSEKRDWFGSMDKFVMATYPRFGDAMFLASEELRANREVARGAIQNDWSAMKYVHPTLQDDLEFVVWALGINTRVIEFVSDRLKDNMEVAMMVAKNINKHDECFWRLSKRMRQDVNVFSCAIHHADSEKDLPYALKLEFLNHFHSNDDIVLEIIKKHPKSVNRGYLNIMHHRPVSVLSTPFCVEVLRQAPLDSCETILGQIWRRFDTPLVSYEIAYQAVLRDLQLVRYIPDLTIIKEVSSTYWQPLVMLRKIAMGRRGQRADGLPLIARILTVEIFDKIMDHLVLEVCRKDGYLASWYLANTVRMNRRARTNRH